LIRDGYLVCGGLYHDMDFARLELLKLLAEHERIRIKVGQDYRDRESIAAADFLVTYTCNVLPAPEEEDALARFLAKRGRWLALHGTNSILEYLKGRGWSAPRKAPRFMRMLGSQFLAHPPIVPYRVEVSDPSHPLTAGLEPFDADDELYLCEYHGSPQALLHTRYRGDAKGFAEGAWPLASAGDSDGVRDDRQLVLYLNAHGGGEVLYCTLGHCRGRYDMRPMMAEYPAIERGSWKLPVFYELLRRGIRWAASLSEEVADVGRLHAAG
jgi:type 1 glutamine amidotransferase